MELQYCHVVQLRSFEEPWGEGGGKGGEGGGGRGGGGEGGRGGRGERGLVQSMHSIDDFVSCHIRSDIGQEVGFEAVGIIDSKLPTTGVWARKSDEVHLLIKYLIEATDTIFPFRRQKFHWMTTRRE